MEVDLDIDVKEASLSKPKRVRNVELTFLPEQQVRETDFAHTILLLTPRYGGTTIVADATYAQYSFVHNIDTLDEYLEEKVCEDNDCDEVDFGYEFNLNMQNDELDPFISAKMICTIRIADGTMVSELEDVGGIGALLDLSCESFETAQNKIFAAMKVEMDKLRLQLEEIGFGTDQVYLEALQKLKEKCGNDGHQSCMQSLELERERRRMVAEF